MDVPFSENGENNGEPEQEGEAKSSQVQSHEVQFIFTDEDGNENTGRLLFVDDGLKFKRDQDPNRPNGVFCFAQKRMGMEALSDRFGNIKKNKKEDRIIEVLRHVEPRLEKLDVIPIGGDPIIHGEIGEDQLIPIPLMGDGLFRLASYALAIAADGEDGIVLIDEIENGLHHSVMEDVWTALFDLAQNVNCQLFATTHSFECVKKAYDAFKEQASPYLKLFRLERYDDEVEAIDYDYESLDMAIEKGMEIR